MKRNKIGLVMGTLLLSTVANAGVGGIWDHFKENSMAYSVPCAISIGVSVLLAKEDKAAIALAGCGVSTAVTYYHLKDKAVSQKALKESSEKMNDSLRKEMRDYLIKTGKEEIVAELKAETYKSIQESILKDESFRKELMGGLKQEFEEYRVLIDQILAIKLGEFKGEISKEIEGALINGPFINLLEEKLTAKLSDSQGVLLESKKKEFVKQCVEDSLDQIVLKQIGVKESRIKIIE